MGFYYLYEKIITLLKKAVSSSNLIVKHSDLAENVENITSGKEVTKTAKLIHQFNSRQSPLVHVIYDKNLTVEQKEELLIKLSQAKPYRFSYETKEERKNIEIPAESIGCGSGFTPKGSPLHHAVVHGTTQMVSILLANGATTNPKGTCIGVKHIHYEGVTPLHIAVAQGDLEKVKLLLQYGADVNAINQAGQTPLFAVTNVEILRLLLDAGANANHQDDNGQSPLHFATKRNEPEIVEVMLKETKININIKDNLGNTPLHLAAATSFEMKNSRSYSSFSWSYDESDKLKNQNLQTMRLLIGNGADVNIENKRGYVPLHMAVLDGVGTIGYDYEHTRKRLLDYEHVHSQIKLLCENGADVSKKSQINKKDSNTFGAYKEHDWHPAPGTTPLLALYTQYSYELCGNKKLAQERLKVASLLIERGSNPKEYFTQSSSSAGSWQEEGNTLMHQCARFADSDGFVYFRSLGLDPNYQASPQHKTPFHEFMFWNSSYFNEAKKSCMQALLDNGISVSKTSIMKVEINLSTISHGNGLSLKPAVISAIFKYDNVISQKAKAMGLEVTDQNNRAVLEQVYKEILNKEHRGQHVSITLEVPLTALEHAYTWYQSFPSYEAVNMIKKQSEEAPVTSYTM